ncbi:MAG TPA: NAD(P)/FAD-dependent oxidoreductase [bacterium]|jgi:phytoene dehydrogenase-like protein|nr:NAD(P)/FAD-dependent oxidoreductase [bacterium]
MPYDVAIIGAGHNGLVTAAYLARAGLRVLVLERRDVLGGACITEEVWPGYRVSTAAYLCGLFQPKIISDLELARFGYEILPKDPAFFSPFPDGRYLFVWRDDARTATEIARFSPRDAARYADYEALLARLAEFIEPTLLAAPPDLMARRVGDLAGMGKLALRTLRLPPRDLVQAIRLATQSARDFLDGWFESEELKSALATDGVIGAPGGPSTPGTAYVLFHHCMGRAAGKAGLWGFVRGGMGGITQALAASARAAGAEIRMEAPVERVRIRGGRVHGVALAGGEEIDARVVASCADPWQTFLRLVPPEHLDADFRRDVASIRMEGVAMKINLALDALPDFTALPGAQPGPQHRGTIHIGPSMEYIDRAWDDARAGRPSARPFVELTIPTLYDPALAPPGKHLMSAFVQYTPYALAEGHWDVVKESYADVVVDTIAEYAPNIRDIILQRQVLSPLDLERDFALSRGDIFHGAMTPDRLFFMRPVPGWAQYRTPIRGLYLCGSGAHPGGGVMGAPGHNAAREIRRDFSKLSRQSAAGSSR